VDRNLGTLIAIVATGLLAAVAIGLVVRGASVPEVAEPAPVAETPKVKGKRDGPKAASRPTRSAPEAPTAVSEDQYTTTASGLQYFDIAIGTGESPVDSGMAYVEYSGFLTDGTRFDSSYTRREALVFPLGKGDVILGWEEGIAAMKVGGKRQLKIASDLAYGEKGKPPAIPPNATLIFDIELIDVKPPRVTPEAPQVLDDSAYTTTETGLKIADLVVGEGPVPQAGQIVQVDYTGWLANGTKFDSSLDRRKPVHFRFAKGKVIAGWDQGLAGMKIGGKRQLIIPHPLAYGEQGRPPVIPPAATLTYEVELVSARDP